MVVCVFAWQCLQVCCVSIPQVRKRNGVTDSALRYVKHLGASEERQGEGGHQIPLPQHDLDLHEPGAAVGAAPGSEDAVTKKYGPKAVFKDGILGNYEPRNLKSSGGPGKELALVYMYRQ